MVFQWRFRSDALMKALSQEPQLNGRSPRCCRSWSFRWDLCLKAFSHIWHAKAAPFWRCGPWASLPCSGRSRGRGGRTAGTPASCRWRRRSPSRGCEDLSPYWCCSCAAASRASRPAPSPSGWRPELASHGHPAPGSPGSSCWSARVSGCTGYPGS
uniref:Uncharacterized protein n=1 Tax=Lates calcarifer TaxID=8187 RepID=A0A4W6FN61_LATCA